MTEASAPNINARPRLKLNGEIRSEVNDALLDMIVSQPLSGMAHAEVRLVNWRANDADGGADFAFQSIEHGTEIAILAGDSDAEPLFSGEITALEERYGRGAPQLIILAEDKLHRLTRSRQNRSFEGTSLNEVLQGLVSGLGLGVDIAVSDYSADWHQLNESNLAFIQRLIAPYDLAIRIDGDTLCIRAEQPDSSPVPLEVQNNIQQLRITADLHQQNLGVSVKGFDLAANDDSEADDDLSPADSGTTAADLLQSLSWGETEIAALPLARAQAEAADWAAGRFHHQAKKFLYGEIVCTGVPELKTGREIKLSGVSERLSGVYRVVDCKHQFNNANGYSTRIKVQRASWSTT
ncbi:MAG: hypothetical protein P8X74_17410 [Reinekea sp.]|jgi:uncharacterized protein